MVESSPWYRGPKRLAARAAAALIDGEQARLISGPQARMVAHGAELAEHYGLEHGRAAVSATLFEREILSVPRRRPASAPFRVLFVGYFRHEKGVDTLLDAFRGLLAQIPNAELEIVGGRDTVEHGVGERLRGELEALSAAIRWRGPLGFNPDLFQTLADADVLVVPSRSEGTPRVLIEARAFGCPVIGTRVGGIPTSISDGIDGLLISPNDPPALTAAMLSIARDAELRSRLVAGGIQRARQATVEAFADAIVQEAALAVTSANGGHRSS
jgi:glycosyltransferase involved in cell wall biosynthesis